jgi:hypothetical protein
MVWNMLKACIGAPFWYMVAYGLGPCFGVIDTCLIHIIGTLYMVVMAHC